MADLSLALPSGSMFGADWDLVSLAEVWCQFALRPQQNALAGSLAACRAWEVEHLREEDHPDPVPVLRIQQDPGP